MAAPSSLQTIPSGIAISTATIHPNMAWGPPRADIKSGIVMNGPTPIMFDMFRAVACTSPKRLSRGAPSFPTFRDSDAMEIIETSFEAHIISEHDSQGRDLFPYHQARKRIYGGKFFAGSFGERRLWRLKWH